MEKSKVKQELREKSISVKLTYGSSVTDSMNKAVDEKGAPLFESQKAKIEAAEKVTKDLKTKKEAADKARSVSEAATAEQTTAEENYDATFTELGNGVDDVAKGSKAIIDKAGMESFVPGKAAPIGKMPQVQALAVTNGDAEGTLDIHFDRVRGASAYVIQFSADPFTDASWKSLSTVTKSSATVAIKEEGVPLGSKVWIRVAAIGSAGQGPWSDPAVKVVA